MVIGDGTNVQWKAPEPPPGNDKLCGRGVAHSSAQRVGNPEASMGDMPKQGSDPKRDLRDEGILAQALAIIYGECDAQKRASDAAQADIRLADMYRHNTALHSLWTVAAKVAKLAEKP